MKVLLTVFLFGAICDSIFAGMAFPSGLKYEVEDNFKKINPNIEWDEENYLVDLSGPEITCNKVGVNGDFEYKSTSLTQKLYGDEGVGGLVADTQSSGGTKSAAARDIRTVTKEWIYREPFKSQIADAKKFGCSVQPDCRGRTLVGCLFTPNSGGQGDDWNNDNAGKQQAVAFTPEQYRITESNLRAINPNVVWDRSHFMENLSGFETRCDMVGRTSWNYAFSSKKAAEYGYRVGFIFGSATQSGNTDTDVRTITRKWMYSEEGRKQVTAAKEVGCSIVQACPKNQVVVACLVSPGV